MCREAGEEETERRRDREKKRWADNINRWTGLDFTNSQRAVKDMEGKVEKLLKEAISGAPTIRTGQDEVE